MSLLIRLCYDYLYYSEMAPVPLSIPGESGDWRKSSDANKESVLIFQPMEEDSKNNEQI